MLHVSPFHAAACGIGPPPTAMQLAASVQKTPRSTGGLLARDQLAPFHDSATSGVPTAKHHVDDEQETLIRPSSVPGVGVGWTVQLEPSQRSASG